MNETPQTSYNPVTMTNQDFTDKYWFNPMQLVTVINPLQVPYPFMVELRHYEIGAGQKKQYPGTIANVYLDQMSRIMAQDDDKLGYIGDPNLRHIYYDKLIVDMEDLAPQAQVQPAYMKNIQQGERAPWDSSLGERASDIPPVMPPSVPDVSPIAPEAPKETTKEFELDGDKFKMITNKNGNEMYYKNSQLTNEETYAKAASML